MRELTTPGVSRRLAYAIAGVAAGCATLPVALFMLRMPWNMLNIYMFFVVSGGLLVGVPIATALPATFISNRPWAICLAFGAALGPLALALVFFAIYVLQGRIGSFSLAHLDSGWPLSMLVSTAGFAVYAALLKGSTVSRNSRVKVLK